jgi:hypothetical protein
MFSLFIYIIEYLLPVIGSTSMKHRCNTSSGFKPWTALCTEDSAPRKCGNDVITGNGNDIVLPLTKQIIMKNKY